MLRKVVEDYKVGGLLFSGGLMQNQAILTNEAQRMADIPLLITFDGEWGLSMRLRGYTRLSEEYGTGDVYRTIPCSMSMAGKWQGSAGNSAYR